MGEIIKTGIAFVIFPIGEAIMAIGEYMLKFCVWITKNNKEMGRFRLYDKED